MDGIKEVRENFPQYNISYIPKKDFLLGFRPIVKDDWKYEEVFISSKNRKYWILYPSTGHMTGSFKSKIEAVNWFKNGGR